MLPKTDTPLLSALPVVDTCLDDMRPTQVIPELVNRYLQHRSAAIEEECGPVIACVLASGGFMVLPIASDIVDRSPMEIAKLASVFAVAAAAITQHFGIASFQTPPMSDESIHVVAHNPVLIDFQMGDTRQSWAIVGLEGPARINGVESSDVGYGADMIQVYRINEPTYALRREANSQPISTSTQARFN